MTRVAATPEMEQLWQEVCTFMQGLCKKHPGIRTIEIIAIIGRMNGYALAACFPNERDLARATAIRNMDEALAEMAAAQEAAGYFAAGPVGRA